MKHDFILTLFKDNFKKHYSIFKGMIQPYTLYLMTNNSSRDTETL